MSILEEARELAELASGYKTTELHEAVNEAAYVMEGAMINFQLFASVNEGGVAANALCQAMKLENARARLLEAVGAMDDLEVFGR